MGFILSGIVFACIMLLPAKYGLNAQGQRCLALFAAVFMLYIFEAVPAAMAERDQDDSAIVYNSAVACGPDGIIGTYRKIHPALAEQCWCTRGDEPFTFMTPFGPIAIGICYDSYNFHELMRYYAASGSRLYLNPTAIGPSGRHDWRDYYLTGLKQGVNACEIFIASSNLTGNNMLDEEEGGSLSNIADLGAGYGKGTNY